MAQAHFEVIVIGAGAAGLMCAIEAAKRGRQVLIIEHSNKPGKKILMSGGGRCNFTNYHIHPDRYLSSNPHFMKSALARYTPYDFIDLVNKYKISFHEKTLGQLFCDNKAKDILNMLLHECEKWGVRIWLNHSVRHIEKVGSFKITLEQKIIGCDSLVIASGGLSIPTLGASGFGYKVAQQFNINVVPTRAGLVPFIFDKEQFSYSELAGVASFVKISCKKISFEENLLFTHKGVSGPSVLQISSYWQSQQSIKINFAPKDDVLQTLQTLRQQQKDMKVKELLNAKLPKRLVEKLIDEKILNKTVCVLSKVEIDSVVQKIQNWQFIPAASEGYRTAEVTLGGVDCNEISSQTMEAKKVPNLYFIGEVLDVTGWLGGYNFQWAWSSGWVAGQVV